MGRALRARHRRPEGAGPGAGRPEARLGDPRPPHDAGWSVEKVGPMPTLSSGQKSAETSWRSSRTDARLPTTRTRMPRAAPARPGSRAAGKARTRGLQDQVHNGAGDHGRGHRLPARPGPRQPERHGRQQRGGEEPPPGHAQQRHGALAGHADQGGGESHSNGREPGGTEAARARDPGARGRSRTSAAAARFRNDAAVDIMAASTAVAASSTAHGPRAVMTRGASSSGRPMAMRPWATRAAPASPTPSHTASIAARAPVSTAGSRRRSARRRRSRNFWT